MRFIVVLAFCFISLFGFTQKLNKLGKIEVDEIPQMPDHRIEKVNDVYKVVKDSFVFEGNTYYEVPSGFITSLEIVDNQKDYIKQYNSEGKLLATILSDRIINLKISKNGSHLAFYNSKNIIQINLNTYKVDTLSGSFVYSYVFQNDLIYFDSENKSIYFRNNKIQIEQYPNQFIEYKDKIYIVTKQNIFELIGNSLFSKYEFKGSFFDSKIINDEFYFVDKEEKRKTESFTLYKTSDFSRIILFDKLDEFNR